MSISASRFLPEFWSKGYAVESASAVLEHGRHAFGLSRIVGIRQAGKSRLDQGARKLGMSFEGRVRIMPEGPEDVLYGIELKARAVS